MGISNILTTYPVYFLVAGAVLAALALWFLKQSTGRLLLDRFRLTAPILGPPTLMGELARFSRTMSVMVGAGLSLQEILEVAPQSSDNRVIREALSEVHGRLLLGEGLSESMSRIDMFPSLLVQMVTVGEQSNTLDFTMGVVADFYETAAEDRTNALVGLLGPASTIGVSLMVGFIAIAVLGPMYSIIGAFD